MRLPRDVTGRQLAKALSILGYQVVRQRGSHIIMFLQGSENDHLVVPDHRPIKPGLLNRLLKDVAEHHGMSRDELVVRLDL